MGGFGRDAKRGCVPARTGDSETECMDIYAILEFLDTIKKGEKYLSGSFCYL